MNSYYYEHETKLLNLTYMYMTVQLHLTFSLQTPNTHNFKSQHCMAVAGKFGGLVVCLHNHQIKNQPKFLIHIIYNTANLNLPNVNVGLSQPLNLILMLQFDY